MEKKRMLSKENESAEEKERRYVDSQRTAQKIAQCMMNCTSCFGAMGCPYFGFYTELEAMKNNPGLYADEPSPKLSKSLEDYLEVIFVIGRVKGTVRSVDVAEFLHYAKPSVSHAVKLLKKGKYLTVDKDGFLVLTDSGKMVAGKVYERHRVLTYFLISIGVDEKLAEQDACKIEHIISEESFSKIKEILEKQMGKELSDQSQKKQDSSQEDDA